MSSTERTRLISDSEQQRGDGIVEGERRSKAAGPKRHHNLANLPAWRFRVICASVWSCSFLCSLDSTIVATLLVPIGSSFHASELSSWLGTAYLLSLCCFTPIYGRLADMIGRRAAYLVAMGFFTTGTFMCAVAPSMYWLIAARCIAGMGGGGIQTIATIIMTDLVSLRRRGTFQGYTNILFGLGGALGGPLGGFISDQIGWRWAFGVQVPALIMASMALYTFIVVPGDNSSPSPDDSVPEPSLRSKLRRIDYLGSLTLAITISCLLLPLSLKTSATKSQAQGGGEYAWSDPIIWGLLVASAAFLVIFVLVEAYVAPQPILPLSLLARRTPSAVAVSLFVVVINQFSIMYNIPLFFSAVRLQSASKSGAHLLPYSINIGIGSVVSGWMMKRTGRYWWTCVGGGLIIVSSSAMLMFWDTMTPEWLTWLAPIPAGFGYAWVLTGTLVALMTNVTRAGKGEVAVATSSEPYLSSPQKALLTTLVSYLFRTSGQVVGVAISAAIVQSIITRDLTAALTGPDAAELIATIRHSTSIIPTLAPAVREAAVKAYEHALRVVFALNMGLSVVGVVALMSIKEEEMPKQRELDEDSDED